MVNHMREPIFAGWFACCRSVGWQQDGDKGPLTTQEVAGAMNPLDLAGLTALMGRTVGRREIVIGLVDGPIATNHPDLASDAICEIPGRISGSCTKTNTTACLHGTFVAGICALSGALS